MSCSICEQRKEKRFCPALHTRICPQCCGESREITLDCPRDCPYLQQAREHDPRVPLSEVDQAALFPQVHIGERFLVKQEQLLLGLSFVLASAARSDASTRDSDLISALSSLAQTYQTLAASGLHYEPATPSPVQREIASRLQNMVREYREAEEKYTGSTAVRDSDVLSALVFLLRMAYAHSNRRPRSRAFLDFLVAQFPEKDSPLASERPAGRIILT